MSDIYFNKGNNLYYGNPDKPENAETISLAAALEELNELRSEYLANTVEVEFELDIETYEKLVKLAKQSGMSQERYINKLVEGYINEER